MWNHLGNVWNDLGYRLHQNVRFLCGELRQRFVRREGMQRLVRFDKRKNHWLFVHKWNFSSNQEEKFLWWNKPACLIVRSRGFGSAQCMRWEPVCWSSELQWLSGDESKMFWHVLQSQVFARDVCFASINAKRRVNSFRNEKAVRFLSSVVDSWKFPSFCGTIKLVFHIWRPHIVEWIHPNLPVYKRNKDRRSKGLKLSCCSLDVEKLVTQFQEIRSRELFLAWDKFQSCDVRLSYERPDGRTCECRFSLLHLWRN